MRRVAVDYLKDGHVLASPIKSSNGSILLTKGAKINSSIKNRLSELGVAVVYIEDGKLSKFSISETVNDSTRKESINFIKDVMLKSTIKDEVQKNSKDPIDINRLNYIVTNLVDELLANTDTLASFAEVRLLDSYTYNHSLDVCIYSLILGHRLKFTRTQLFELGLGALLHDVGKSKIPIDIINKPGILNPEEFEKVKEHPLLGYEIMRANKRIPLLSAHVALQHHERYNGGGYPRKLKGNEIHPYGYVVGIADMFDALTSEKKYRPKFSIKEAIEILNSAKGILFPKEYVDQFLQCISIYPTGYKVKLNTGDIGVVVGQGQNPLTPLIKVVNSEDNINDFIDLAEHDDLWVEEIVYE